MTQVWNIIYFLQTDLLDPKNKEIMDSCFDPTDGGKDLFGWCATCDADAKRGQRGYCGPGETNREEDAPIIQSNSTNWGFCHKDCRSRRGDEDMLQARVHFISIRLLSWHFLNYYLRDIKKILLN